MGFISSFPIFDFNPHSHEGSDERKSMGMAKKLSISIHTPTKGATFVGGFPFSSSGLFQSTLPRRERLKHILMDSRSLGFQSTLPRRERHIRLCDSSFFDLISIHTPTKGATAILTNNFLIFCSISLINFILYLQIIQILFIFRYKFIFYFIF